MPRRSRDLEFHVSDGHGGEGFATTIFDNFDKACGFAVGRCCSGVRTMNIDVDLMGCDFAVDTALSWDGNFPKPGKGDYLVTLGDVNKGNAQVLVSRRYVVATGPEDAAALALDAFSEQQGYRKDDEGNILEVTISGFGTGQPCWVEKIDAVY